MKTNLFKFWKLITIIGTLIGIFAAGIAIYDWATEDEFTIEQRVSPEVMDRVRNGEEVILEKGIRMREDGDVSGSRSD